MNGVLAGDTQDVTTNKLLCTLEAAAVAKSFLNSFDNPDLSIQLFHAIVKMTLELGEQQVEIGELIFDSFDLSEYIIKHFHCSKQFDQQDISERTKWITTHWKKLSTQLPDFETGLTQHAQRLQYRHIPKPVKIESMGGRGKRTFYKLEYSTIPSMDKPPDESETAPELKTNPQPCRPSVEHITYTTARAKILLPWVRWLEHLKISGRTKLVFACLMALGYALSCAWTILAFLTLSRYWLDQPIQSWQILAFYPGIWIILPIVIFGMPFWRLSMHKIIPSPFLFTLFQSVTDDLFLELSRTDGCHRIDPDKPRSIRLVSYSARCPICNGFVSIEGGGWKYPGRLIGRCYESPREHVWSFDHVTLSGRRLH